MAPLLLAEYDEQDTTAPDGHTRFTPDRNHPGDAMRRQKLREHWMKAENLEMFGLIRHQVWERVVRGDGMERRMKMVWATFEDAFSSVPNAICASSLRLLLAIASSYTAQYAHIMLTYL